MLCHSLKSQENGLTGSTWQEQEGYGSSNSHSLQTWCAEKHLKTPSAKWTKSGSTSVSRIPLDSLEKYQKTVSWNDGIAASGWSLCFFKVVTFYMKWYWNILQFKSTHATDEILCICSIALKVTAITFDNFLPPSWTKWIIIIIFLHFCLKSPIEAEFYKPQAP